MKINENYKKFVIEKAVKGDYIVTNGNEGTVESISILYTELVKVFKIFV